MEAVDSAPPIKRAYHTLEPLVPTLHLLGFMTCKQELEDGSIFEPQDWAADDLITVEEALPIMTIESAYALLRDDEPGSLVTGKLADLVILSANPLEIDSDDIPDIQVLMTMVGGKVEHCAPGHESLCP